MMHTTAIYTSFVQPRVCWKRGTTTPRKCKYKFKQSYKGKDVGPTYGFTASPKVGPRATVGTL
jgi:hypothetical protein